MITLFSLRTARTVARWCTTAGLIVVVLCAGAPLVSLATFDASVPSQVCQRTTGCESVQVALLLPRTDAVLPQPLLCLQGRFDRTMDAPANGWSSPLNNGWSPMLQWSIDDHWWVRWSSPSFGC